MNNAARSRDSSAKVTIADVAALAEVSIPTVSRVLTGAATVSPARLARVERAIKVLDYRPNAAARMLVSRKPRTVAILTGDTSHYGYAETIRGIEESARAEGYAVLIAVIENASDEAVEKAIAVTVSQPLAGLFVLKFDAQGSAALQRIPRNIPVVALSGLRDTSIPQAMLDEASAAEELTDYLLDQGHQTVHHVRIPPSRREDGRTTGWKRSLRRAKCEIPEVLDATWDPLSGVAIGAQLFTRKDVTAVFCGNDEIAMGVIRGILDAGGRVPQDVSVVGFDGHPLGEIWSPPLTTVVQDFVDMGRRGFELMRQEIEGLGGRRYSKVRPPLVVRGSSGPPPGANRS